MTTGNELEEILAESAQQPEQVTEGQIRDEHGRFAPRAETAPEVPEPPEVIEPTTQAEAEPGKVPQQALHAAREKEREARNEVDQLRQQLAVLNGQMQMLSRSQAPQAPQEPTKADFWEDPDGWGNSLLSPIQQQMQQQNERWSRRFAEQQHGAETVNSAYQALGQAMQAGDPAAVAEFQRLKQSDHPFGDIVAWHKRQTTMSTVGDDPNAWFEAEMERRMADPAFSAKYLERARTTAATNTNRSAPVTSLPPSLNRLPSGGNAPADVDMSDNGIFAQAMRP